MPDTVAERGRSNRRRSDEARDLEVLVRQIQRATGFRLTCYKERCFRRRLALRMRESGASGFRDYAAHLRRHPREYERLLASVLIQVSRFFRDGRVWSRIREQVVPALFELRASRVGIWSAGTAQGEEAYSMAIALLDHARRHGRENELDRFRITATDLSAASVARARAGEYGEHALTDTPPGIRKRWFRKTADRTWRVHDHARALVRFRPADLLADPPPSGQHLILCRNVLIYLERPYQYRILERLTGALTPGGWLVLGLSEVMAPELSGRYESAWARERVFRVVDGHGRA